MKDVLHEETVTLEPRAISARQARVFLTRLLTAAGRERWLESAQLAVSEIVTNGVLHAHTTLELTARVSSDELRVEVCDSNPQLPMQRSAEEATTGRGMQLVAAVVSECGVQAVAPAGKVVWFVLRDNVEEPSVDDLLAAWDVDDMLEPPVATTVEATLRLPGFPPTLWLAAREHHIALLREYVLYTAEHADAEPVDFAAADEARMWVTNAALRAIDEAREAGLAQRPLPSGHPSPLPSVPRVLDLEVTLPRDGQGALLALQDALDGGERLAVADRLLLPPGLPEIIALRDWVCDTLIAQLAGVEPTPWPGTDQEHFTVRVNERDGAADAVWDVAMVRDAARGVVAADEANRIVAVSRPLADALGWDVDDLVGRRVVALIPPALREAHVAGFSRHLTTGQANLLGVPLQLPVLHHDGHELVCDFLIEHAPDTGARAVYLAWITPSA